MSLLASIKGRRGESGFGFASTADEVTAELDLSGRTVLITGINSGLGLESGRVLASRGAHVIGVARTQTKAESAGKELGGSFSPAVCELSEPDSVRACVQQIVDGGQPLDVILCNAGIMAPQQLEQKNDIELQFFTNHIGHFILVTGLLEMLAKNGRVVMLSSGAHYFTYKGGIDFDNLSGASRYVPFKAYGQSKLANLLFAKELARRLEGSQQTANAVHPGAIMTNLGRHLGTGAQLMAPFFNALFMKNVPQGAASQCYAAVHPDAAEINGAYFVDCNVNAGSAHARDAELASRLWQVSEEIVAELPMNH